MIGYMCFSPDDIKDGKLLIKNALRKLGD